MRDRYSRVLTAIYQTPWAIEPSRIPGMQLLLGRWASGIKLTAAEIEAATGARAAQADTSRTASSGAVAVLPIYGVISQRISMMDDLCGEGGSSTERVSDAFAALMADPSVGAIVLDIDSPGGSVYGTMELAEQIFQARGTKKIVAVADSLAASAAYWIGSAAEDFYITPGGEAGSIGVFAMHEDYSEMLAAMGIKTTFIKAGKYKTEGNPYGPLDEEAQAFMQSRVDDYYDSFVKAVARNRKTSQDSVRNGYGQGRCLGADDAVKSGLCDAVRTLDDVVAELAARPQAQKPRTRQQAESLDRRLRIEELT